MSNIERRKFVRKPIRMGCAVQFSSGATIYGNTKDISLDGVTVETNDVSNSAEKTVTPGEYALLTLKFRNGAVADAILVKGQVMHVSAGGIGLSVRFAELNKREQNLLGQMIATGRPEVESS